MATLKQKWELLEDAERAEKDLVEMCEKVSELTHLVYLKYHDGGDTDYPAIYSLLQQALAKTTEAERMLKDVVDLLK